LNAIGSEMLAEQLV